MWLCLVVALATAHLHLPDAIWLLLEHVAPLLGFADHLHDLLGVLDAALLGVHCVLAGCNDHVVAAVAARSHAHVRLQRLAGGSHEVLGRGTLGVLVGV